MSRITFEQFDSAYIAKLILEKLGIDYDAKNEDNLFLIKNKELIETITSIEKLENNWKLITDNKEHTFGRKELNEIIKLWSVPKKSAEVLENLVILTGAKNILEIGTSAGYSTLHLANGAKLNGGKVYTIELLKEKIELAKTHFQKSGFENITLLENEASKVLSDWNFGEIDFVFLDADKENYGKYFDLLLPKMKIGALIIADNINDYGHMMEDYLQKLTGSHSPQSRVNKHVKSYYLAALGNGLMITKKISD